MKRMSIALVIAALGQGAHAQEHQMQPMAQMQQPMPMEHAQTQQPMPMEHAQTQQPTPMEHAQMQQPMGAMHGMFGPYLMTREASGTSWQPDATPMDGIHSMRGDWMTMLHGYVNGVYDHQGGPRGDTSTFAESMLMGMAQRDLDDGTLGLRAMVSLDPAMGKRGYPLLFETGETADGRTPLVDRQHPHDLLMELAASYSRRLGNDRSVFLYAGLPGEPALGPTAFMHRFSGVDNPEAPLTHHWLDSTHITFGVVTAGYVWRNVKLEGSVFNGREPDQNRWNIELRKLDSYSARLTWNPTPQWSMQVSHGRLASPELLEPQRSVSRTTASASYQMRLAGQDMQTTFAWGRNRKDQGGAHDGYLLESALRMRHANTVFARIEHVANDELFREDEPLHGQTFNVGKASIGVVHDFAWAGPVRIGAGALVSKYWKSPALDPVYGSNPTSAMVFVRAKLAMR